MPIIFVEKMREAFAIHFFIFFFNKNFSVFSYKVVKYLTSGPFNELVKLTMLSTTEPLSYFIETNKKYLTDRVIRERGGVFTLWILITDVLGLIIRLPQFGQ